MNSSSPFVRRLERPLWQTRLRQSFRSHWTFAVLQVLDLLTTVAVFHAGGVELNPLVARLTLHFGRVGGVVMSKVIAVVLAMGVRRLIWVVNIFYAGLICWNLIVLILLSAAAHTPH
jgi:hypothetical protein